MKIAMKQIDDALLGSRNNKLTCDLQQKYLSDSHPDVPLRYISRLGYYLIKVHVVVNKD